MDGKITALAIVSEEEANKIRQFCEKMQDWDIFFLPFANPKNGMAEMLRRQIDIIILSLRSSTQADLDLLADIQRTDSTCPVICLVHAQSEFMGVSAIRSGAADYLVLEYLSQSGFERALLNVMEKNTMLQQIARQRKELRHLSAVDELTGLYNRRFCIERLVTIVLSATRYQHPLSLCMCDLDHFKSVNDKYGHQAGDEVLSQFGKLVREELRSVDFAGRYGGDEFFIVFPHTAAQKSAICAERIRRGMENIKLSGDRGQDFSASATFGISDLLPEHKNEMDLLETADQALYEAKQQGRNQIVLRERA